LENGLASRQRKTEPPAANMDFVYDISDLRLLPREIEASQNIIDDVVNLRRWARRSAFWTAVLHGSMVVSLGSRT
jgi:hypothetical protein